MTEADHRDLLEMRTATLLERIANVLDTDLQLVPTATETSFGITGPGFSRPPGTLEDYLERAGFETTRLGNRRVVHVHDRRQR